MNKPLLLKYILSELEIVHQGAIDAAQRAYDTATNEENEVENKYDTLGLEASYLAHDQSKRVIECATDVIAFKKLEPLKFLPDSPVTIGALVTPSSPIGKALCACFVDDEIEVAFSSDKKLREKKLYQITAIY